MEQTGDDIPPTSAILLDPDHCNFSQVVFNDVEKFYVPGGDIICNYTFTQHFIPRRKDWIGIFRVGWKTTREYYTFMWATLPRDLNTESATQQKVQFKAYYLPKDDEYYQFCYVDEDGVVRAASVPFQFRPESEDDILVVTTEAKVEEIEERNKELCRENQDLKDSCASLQKQSSDMQAELQRKQEELESLQRINNTLEQQMKEQKACWETELHQVKEHNQKISSEHEKMRIRLDQLQTQLSAEEKEMKRLVLEDQNKAEQLQRLTKENDQLSLSLTEQSARQEKLQQALEETKQRDAAAAKQHQELTDEIFELSRRLDDNKVKCDVLQKDKERLEQENNRLKRENSRMLKYMGLDGDSLLYQMPSSDHGDAGPNPGLVYGNPYSGIQESSAPSPLSKPKYLTCQSSCGDGICGQASEQEQMQSLYVNCPVCNKVFLAREKQIFDDHVFCHSL
uniref:calcium-binding and coiled-coil domain-containing protein 2 n=1 Tax=Jaculus jaculus TaxID=51337 RepID=UPI001E1B3E23|nr:calcium-binding and coiled-coil domain-containing protein 2 [Jaculus jaculus]XP_045015524.1 calcium-binding and coiled-coil domain-containing protein 2 [Jaculus jaculus]